MAKMTIILCQPKLLAMVRLIEVTPQEYIGYLVAEVE